MMDVPTMTPESTVIVGVGGVETHDFVEDEEVTAWMMETGDGLGGDRREKR